VMTGIQAVRILNKTGLVEAWTSPDSLSMAASCGSLIAAAHGNSVTILSVDSASGKPETPQTLHFSQQVSAVTLLEMPEAFLQVGELHLTWDCEALQPEVFLAYPHAATTQKFNTMLHSTMTVILATSNEGKSICCKIGPRSSLRFGMSIKPCAVMPLGSPQAFQSCMLQNPKLPVKNVSPSCNNTHGFQHACLLTGTAAAVAGCGPLDRRHCTPSAPG